MQPLRVRIGKTSCLKDSTRFSPDAVTEIGTVTDQESSFTVSRVFPSARPVTMPRSSTDANSGWSTSNVTRRVTSDTWPCASMKETITPWLGSWPVSSNLSGRTVNSAA